MRRLDAVELQRLRYRQGQMLLSRDFRDELRFTAQSRWWHNRAEHNAFGVVDGFHVRLDPQSTGSAVIVSPGLAYDCFGRELISQREQLIPIPSSSEPMTLLVRYQDTRSYEPGAELMEACLPEPCSLLEERPDFVWKPSGRTQPQDGVPLTQVTYAGSSAQLDSTFHAPTVRPLARPFIANGATIAGATPWEVWSIPYYREGLLPIGLQVQIDTSKAGFSETPCYFASLQVPLSEVTAANALLLSLIGYHAEYVMEATDNGFTFRLFLPLIFWSLSSQKSGQIASATSNPLAAFEALLLGFVQQQQWSVCWLGIQKQSVPEWEL